VGEDEYAQTEGYVQTYVHVTANTYTFVRTYTYIIIKTVSLQKCVGVKERGARALFQQKQCVCSQACTGQICRSHLCARRNNIVEGRAQQTNPSVMAGGNMARRRK
jgi:hypothetical protein